MKSKTSPIKFAFKKTLAIGAMTIAFLACHLSDHAWGQSLNPAPATPSGWKKTTVARNATVFSKSDLKRNETLTVKYFQRTVLDSNQSLELWMTQRMTSGKAPLGGEWTGLPTITRQTGNMIEGRRDFKVGDKKHLLRGLAVGVDNVHVRFASLISSNTSVKQYDRESARLLYKLMTVEKEAAAKEKRGTDLEISPPKVKNLKAGGKIKPGRYVGNAIYLKDNKIGRKYDLILFENGEFEFLEGGDKYKKTGRYVYSNATGRLNLLGDFINSTYDPSDEYCVFGKEATGKTVIFAREGRWQRKLKWVSESERPSPSEVARAEEIAKAEAKRYKHVTEPGKGIAADEIEAILYVWETAYRSGAVQLDQEGYLLMKDGRVLDGLPAAPDTIDVAVSRSREPDRWGWWKKEEDKFTFAWPVRPREYRQPNGKQEIGVPFEKGTRLAGDFGMAKTSVMLVSNYSSVRWWGIKLSKNGRFLKYRNGSTQIGGVPGMEAISTAVWDDEGAIATTLSPSITTMSKRKNNRPGSDRMGTYEFDKFRLTLTFDDGHIEHHATFTDEKKENVWFEGSRLYLRDEKKK
jgi:hypothetical protein